MRFLALIILLSGCSKKIVSDLQLKNNINSRNQKVMLEYGILIIPPNLENIPTEKESIYEKPKEEKK